MSQQQLNAGLLQGDVGHIGLIPVAAIGTIPASSDITAILKRGLAAGRENLNRQFDIVLGPSPSVAALTGKHE